MTTPVLLLIFNRPGETAQVMDAIRQARPPRLYISADGPRKHLPEESRLCEMARTIATNVDWPCEVKTRFLDSNMGCKKAVSTGITWFFEQESAGIILEDDTVPGVSFFRFMELLLERYRDDDRVMAITGLNSLNEPIPVNTSYLFSRYPLMWGWASWRRAWNLYDIDMKQWPQLRQTDWLKTIGDGSSLFKKQWQKVFDDCYEGNIDTWDFQWIYSCWVHSGLTAMPSKNLVKNIGFGPTATHTQNSDDSRFHIERMELEFPLRHPEGIIRFWEVDRYLDKHWFDVEWNREVKRTLLKNPLIRIAANWKRQIKTYFQK